MIDAPKKTAWEIVSPKLLTEDESEINISVDYFEGSIYISFVNSKIRKEITYVVPSPKAPIEIMRLKLGKTKRGRKFPIELTSFELNTGILKAKFDRKR